jgi:hypothetical protein
VRVPLARSHMASDWSVRPRLADDTLTA